MERVATLTNDNFEDLKILTSDGCVTGHLAPLGYFSLLLRSLLAPCHQEEDLVFILLPDFSIKEVISLFSILFSGEVMLNKKDMASLIKLTKELNLRPIALSCDTMILTEDDNHPVDQLGHQVVLTKEKGIAFGDQGVRNLVRKEVDGELVQRVLSRTVGGGDDMEEEVKGDQFLNNIQGAAREERKCYVCGARIRGHNSFLDHLRLHREQGGPYTCPKCGHLSSTGLLVHRHFLDNHVVMKVRRDEGGGHRCEECGKESKTFTEFKTHMNQNHGLRPLKCNDCDQRFNDKLGLKTHTEAKHVGIKSHSCDVCYKCFSTARFLSHHRRQIHELAGRRQAECDLCGFVSLGKSNLRKHVKTVHEQADGGKHKCTACLRLFKTKFNLMIHLRTHTNESPFSCPHCSLKFRRKQHLKSHNETCRSNGQHLSLENFEFIVEKNDTECES